MKKVSVCVPVYNVEKYVRRCLLSLFNQTMKNEIEFIIVNDGTPDNSMKVVLETVKEFPELDIKIIEHDRNKGIAQARNTALNACSGEYVIYVDSDDWCSVDYIELLYNEMVNSASDIVICDSYRVNSENDPNPVVRPAFYGKNIKENIAALFKDNKNAAMWVKLVKRSLYTKNNITFPSNIEMGEDTLVTAKLFLHSDKISFVKKPLFFHFNNPQSMTNNGYDKKGEHLLTMYDEIQKLVADSKIDFSDDLLNLKLRIKRQLIEKSSNRKKYYKLWPETNSIVLKSNIASHLKIAILVGSKCSFLAEVIFNIRKAKRCIKQPLKKS